MGKDVIKKLSELAAAFYKTDIADGAKRIEEMEKKKTIIKEIWG